MLLYTAVGAYSKLRRPQTLFSFADWGGLPTESRSSHLIDFVRLLFRISP